MSALPPKFEFSCHGPLDAISNGLQRLCWGDYIRSVQLRLVTNDGRGGRWWNWTGGLRARPAYFAGCL